MFFIHWVIFGSVSLSVVGLRFMFGPALEVGVSGPCVFRLDSSGRDFPDAGCHWSSTKVVRVNSLELGFLDAGCHRSSTKVVRMSSLGLDFRVYP